jgi:hypothetical protein
MILVAFGGLSFGRFWGEFSPLFGLRAVRDMPVLRDFSSSGGQFGPCFGPTFRRTFHHPRVCVLGGQRRVSGEISVMSGLAREIGLGDGCHLCPVASEINPPDLERSRDCHLRRQNEVR